MKIIYVNCRVKNYLKELYSHLLQLRKESLTKIQACTGYNFDDLPSNNSSLRSSLSYIHNFIIILSRVFNEPIQWPAPSWLVSLIGRALHRYRRGQRFESRIEAWIFFRLSFRNCISCVYNCDDPPSNKRVDNHYKLQKKTDNRLHVWIYSRPPITRTFKAKRVRVIESTKQITRSKEMGWAGEECKYQALPTSRAAKDIDILDIIQQSWINQYER